MSHRQAKSCGLVLLWEGPALDERLGLTTME
jgi:hypothetical protein